VVAALAAPGNHQGLVQGPILALAVIRGHQAWQKHTCNTITVFKHLIYYQANSVL